MTELSVEPPPLPAMNPIKFYMGVLKKQESPLFCDQKLILLFLFDELDGTIAYLWLPHQG
jgi:hypothetical protein